jgi:hypothetical protein
MDAHLVRRVDNCLEPGILRLFVLRVPVVVAGCLQSVVPIQHVKAFQLLEDFHNAGSVFNFPKSVVSAIHSLPLAECLMFLHGLMQAIVNIESLIGKAENHGPDMVLDEAVVIISGPAECFLVYLNSAVFIILI